MPKQLLASLSDGSKLLWISAKELSQIPIWHGNRIIDDEHVKKLQESVGHPRQFDSKPFHIVYTNQESEEGTVEEACCIVDGQHRAQVLKAYFAAQDPFEDNDFQLLAIEKYCLTESEVIKYFQILNTTKAIEWKGDPKLIANQYVDALCNVFNTKKHKRIRNGKTRKPYISIETLRNQIMARRVGLCSQETPEAYADRIFKDHQTLLDEFAAQSPDTLSQEYKTALKAECLLGVMKGWDWIDTQ